MYIVNRLSTCNYIRHLASHLRLSIVSRITDLAEWMQVVSYMLGKLHMYPAEYLGRRLSA